MLALTTETTGKTKQIFVHFFLIEQCTKKKQHNLRANQNKKFERNVEKLLYKDKIISQEGI